MRLRYFLLLLCLVVIPLIDRDPYHIDVLTNIGIFILLAVGLNVVVGFAGLLNLGYGAFFAIGAYSYAMLNIYFGLSFWLGIPISAIISGIFGILLGAPAIRVRGDYLAIVTLGFGEIIRIIFNNLDRLTGGPNGLLGIAHPILFDFNFGVQSSPYYYLVLCLAISALFITNRLSVSRIGRAWIAVREDEVAASCAGIDTTRVKVLAFGIGASVAGIAGCVFASKQGTVTPDSFDFILSVMILSMVVLGGLGSIKGAILGAMVLTLLPEILRGFALYRMLIFGLAMIAIMLFRPQGLAGTRQRGNELRPEYEKLVLEEDETLSEDRKR